MATNIEWTFGLISNISSLKPSNTYLYENYRNQSQDCFLVCTNMVEECQMVTLTKDRCYCSTDLTPGQSEMENGSLVYFKRPVKGKNDIKMTGKKRNTTSLPPYQLEMDTESLVYISNDQ